MGGPAGSYAREMERLSAKESLLLAVRFSVCSFFFLLLRFYVVFVWVRGSVDSCYLLLRINFEQLGPLL
jgi:hypothetical protein